MIRTTRGPPNKLGFTKCTKAVAEKRKVKVTAVISQKCQSVWQTETAL